MPFTPFHFGPALLVKAIASRSFSFGTFVAVQVVIDLETLYHLIRRDWPVHRELHSLVGGAAVGVALGVAVWLAGSMFVRRLPLWPAVRAEVSFMGTLVGGLVGGISHSILDGMMHRDVRPYWPFSEAPGWSGMVSVGALHLACVLSGVLGCGILWLTLKRQRAA